MLKRRVLSLVLALCLLFGAMPFAAGASESFRLSSVMPDQSLRYVIMKSLGYVYPLPKDVTTTAEDLAAIESLNLYNYQSLVSDLTGIEYLPNLKLLNISSFNLSIPDVVWTMTSLEYLNIANMGLTELPAEIGNLTNLRTLIVGDFWSSSTKNNLTALPDEIGNLTKLEQLDISRNSISELPDSFANIHTLIEFEARSNAFTEFPAELLESTGLEKLDFYYNKLSELPDGLSALVNLKKLELSSNLFESVPGVLESLNTDLVDFSYNPMKAVIPDWVLAQENVWRQGIHLQSFYGNMDDQSATQNQTLDFNLFIPDVMRQIIAMNDGKIDGKWEIVQPDGETVQITSRDGSEMSAYVFSQLGDYQVNYHVPYNDGGDFEFPMSTYQYGIGSIYKTKVTVTEAPVDPTPFLFDEAIAGMAISDTGEYSLSIGGFLEATVSEGSNVLTNQQIGEQFLTINAKNLKTGEKRVLYQNTVEGITITVQNGAVTEIRLRGRVQTTNGAFDRYTAVITL